MFSVAAIIMHKNFSTHIKPILLCMVALAVVTVMVFAMTPSVAMADSGVVLSKATDRPEPPRGIYVDDNDQYRRRTPRRPESDDKGRYTPPPQRPSDDNNSKQPTRRPSDDKGRRTPPPQRPSGDKTRPDQSSQRPSGSQSPNRPSYDNHHTRPDEQYSQTYYGDTSDSDLRKKASRFSRTWHRTNRDEVLRINNLTWSWKYGKTYSDKGKTFDSGKVIGYEDGKLVLRGRSGKYYASIKNNKLTFQTAGGRYLTFK